MRKTIAACVVTALAAGAGTATAGKLITGKDIANGSITGVDVKRGSLQGSDVENGSLQSRDIENGGVTLADLAPAVRSDLAKAGTPGPKGETGATGAQGAKGDKGDTGAQGDKGDTGAQGDKGDAGAQGIQGEKGDKGDAGVQGIQGIQGEKGDKGDTGAPGQNGTDGGLPVAFRVTNKSVGLTASGVDFGPYGDGGAAGGSLSYKGLNGRPLSDITSLTYTYEYSTSDGNRLGAPYLRVFLNDDTADVIYDPTACATATPVEDAAHAVDVTASDVRFNDDGCDGTGAGQQAWSDVVSAHGTDVISGIYVSTGFSGGHDVRAFVTSFSVNGEQFDFVG